MNIFPAGIKRFFSLKNTKNLFISVVFCICCFACEAPEPYRQETKSDGLLCEVAFDPYRSEQLVIELIRQSQTSIDIALYGFSNERIADELVVAAERGVIIRGVSDYDSEDGEGWQLLYDAIREGSKNIDVRLTNLTGIMHNKYFIIDNINVVTGSTNFTDGMFLHYNNLIVFKSSSMALDFKKDFDLLYAGFSGTDKGCSLSLSADDNGYNRLYGDGIRWSEKEHRVGNYEVAIFFTPYRALFPSYMAVSPRSFEYFNYESGAISRDEYGNAMNTIFPLIENANKNIYIMSFAFTDKVLMELLANARARGVTVHVRSDYSQFRSSYSHSGKSIEALSQRISSFKLCRKDDGGLLHHKVILVDDEIVVLGSLNFSRNAVSTNDENYLIIRNAGVLYELFMGEFRRVDRYCREVSSADVP
jgi:phosphatidylserine/phosphatidylglycerophosphate/cardiolipin synthase-like enzyme